MLRQALERLVQSVRPDQDQVLVDGGFANGYSGSTLVSARSLSVVQARATPDLELDLTVLVINTGKKCRIAGGLGGLGSKSDMVVRGGHVAQPACQPGEAVVDV